MTCGKCGENLTWRMEGDTLYIEGRGAIEKGAFISDGSIRKVVIASGCTDIGERAFSDCDTLETVELPAGLKRIGAEAFYWCDRLKQIKLPDGLECIEEKAFALFMPDQPQPPLLIPASVTKIGAGAFKRVNTIIYDGPAQDADNWGAQFWRRTSGEAANPPRTVALHCGTCRSLNNTPLTLNHRESFSGAEIAVYSRGVSWDGQVPVPGTEMEITVYSPFCCDVNDTFWAMHTKEQFVQAQLVRILSLEEYEAKVCIRILQIRDQMSFVKPVPDAVKRDLRDRAVYDYRGLGGDSPHPLYRLSEKNILHLYNSYGGGDINYDEYIYTDPDGFDHLFRREYSDFEENCLFIGDQVLGYHENSPYQWENGLLIDRRTKTVIYCEKDKTEVVIPQGIVRLGWFAFSAPLNRIVIPDSVRDIYHAFSASPKEVILTGNSQLNERALSSLRGSKIWRVDSLGNKHLVREEKGN